ncbi:MAG: phosphoglucosamine mutase [Gammaproteobacteria bacterium]|jgi:phosphoglucosamine mutase
MSRRYFGTDGVRGRTGRAPMTADFVLKLGWAAGRVLSADGHPLAVIGKDTRISGYMFESALQAGLSAAGVDVRLLGPMPTPAVAYLTRTLRASVGIVISASHNPYYDNGIKFFSAAGTKLPDDVERSIEAEMAQPMETVDSAELGKAERVVDAAGRYIEYCKASLPSGTVLHGLRIVVDCAHGATYHVAPDVFEELGAEVLRMGDEPNGLNINDGCGATAPQALCDAVLRHQADLGIALDGDGDRLIMVDHRGEVVDGDELLGIIARHRHAEGTLEGGVVGTQMTNLGLEQLLGRLGIPFCRAAVGDRYVMELLQAEGWRLGGESSGHIICLDRTTTGDGVISALLVLQAILASEQSLHSLKKAMHKYPQTLVNVPVEQTVDLEGSPLIRQAVADVERSLNGSGRVLLRASGTEPLVRVMVEGDDTEAVKGYARQIAEAVQASASGV